MAIPIYTYRVVTAIVLVLLHTIAGVASSRGVRWTAEQIDELSMLTLSALEPLPPDPTNRVADDPRAVDLGRRLFFDTRLSSNGIVSCGSCHSPEHEFQDDRPLAIGVGTASRRTMPIAGTAYSPFLFWDGRKDSQWSQALGPLENPVEHGGTRAQYAHVIADYYREDYKGIFGSVADLAGIPFVAAPVDEPTARKAWMGLTDPQRDAVTEVFVNIGKAIAAYERRVEYAPSRFDRYVDDLQKTGREPEGVLTQDEVAGLRLFIGKANCTQCHNGPLLTNNEFHNTGVTARPDLPQDVGRLAGARNILRDEFNCRSRWSDASSKTCAELDFLDSDGQTLMRAFKVPSLRSVADRAPYMHAGQLASLADVLDHYDRAPAASTGHSELKPLHLKPQELRQLEAFLRSLGGGTIAALD